MVEDRKTIRQPFVRNYFLPRWLHRLFNAVIASLLLATVLLLVWPNLKAGLGAALAAGIVLLFVNPDRLSFVEGTAGEDGYCDLD